MFILRKIWKKNSGGQKRNKEAFKVNDRLFSLKYSNSDTFYFCDFVECVYIIHTLYNVI